MSEYNDAAGTLVSKNCCDSDACRASSLIRELGNAVFISGSSRQAQNLVDRTLSVLMGSGYKTKSLYCDIGELIDSAGANAASDFKKIICDLRASAKTLVITGLERALEDEGVVCELFNIASHVLVPFIGLTDMKGFHKLEERRDLAGLLQFVLAPKEAPSTIRDRSILIIGASSLFGNAVYRLFKPLFSNVTGTGFTKAPIFGFDSLDVTSEDDIKRYFGGRHFDIVIYIAGEANADAAEDQKDRARALNVDAVGLLSKHAKKSKFVYISSEYVFDGNNGPYASFDEARPANYYGSTKLEGEAAALNGFPGSLILRLGALYGYNGPHDKQTSVAKLIASMGKAGPLEADNIQIKHPVLLEDAAATLLKLLDLEASGIFQINGSQGLTKQQMAEEIAAVKKEITGRSFAFSILGIEQPGRAAKPFNTHMVNVDTPRPFKEGIRFLIERLNN